MRLHHPAEQILDANLALQMLREGNQRFVQEQLCDKSSYTMDREVLAEGQNPFAVVICCSDSRVVPEIFFDQRMGDLFVIRNAGNVVDDVVLASVEYALEGLSCPLVVVCGHSHCGAVTAACHGDESLRHFPIILERLQPALQKGGTIEMVAQRNVRNMVARLQDAVEVFSSKATVVGSYYDIFSGEVLWLEDWIARGCH